MSLRQYDLFLVLWVVVMIWITFLPYYVSQIVNRIEERAKSK